jgi:hypothetical protein
MMATRMHSSKDTAGKAVGRSAARDYYEVALDFASDNGGKVPVPGTPDWPNARPELGPVNYLNKTSTQRYFRHIPEAVTDGRVYLKAGALSVGQPTAPLSVTYTVSGAQTFDIVVAKDSVPYCHMANGPVASSLPEC